MARENDDIYLKVLELSRLLPEKFLDCSNSEHLWLYDGERCLETTIHDSLPLFEGDESPPRHLDIPARTTLYNSLSEVVDKAISDQTTNPNVCVVLVPYKSEEITDLFDILTLRKEKVGYQVVNIGEYSAVLLKLNQTTGTD